MSSKKPRIICVTGSDGSGKSTLIGHLVEVLPTAKEITIWDALAHKDVSLFSNKKNVDGYLCSLSPDARSLFLAHALKYAIDSALASNVETIVLNAYYYKYFSSEILMGANKELVKSLEVFFPAPDTTIFLSLPPEISMSRKKQFSNYECGCNKATVDNFVKFQKKVTKVLHNYIQPDWIIINAENPLEEIKEKALQIITKS